MRQANSVLSTYTADVSGVCSALYELGGMTIMHDASGCNSTYNTHDEPRWYSQPSMVYISALTEMEAMMGDDGKLIRDACETALALKPRFIALCGTPIPMMMGTDFPGLARVIQRKTGIPAFGFATNGMHSYLMGAGMALAGVAERFLSPDVRPGPAGGKIPLNLLGVTPLDFSVTGNLEALRELCEENGFSVQSCWAMGDRWENLMEAGRARVSLVVSACGLPLAKMLQKRYGIPYVTGIPVGRALAGAVFDALRRAAKTGENRAPTLKVSPVESGHPALVIGEPVWAASVRAALMQDFGLGNVRVVTMVEEGLCPLLPWDRQAASEDEVFALMKNASLTVADPMYRGALPEGGRFVDFPHEGCSGRIWRKNIPIFMGEAFDDWFQKQ